MTPPDLLKAAILIVSDTASADPSTDKAGSILQETFAQDGRWTVVRTAIVPDNLAEIQTSIKDWCDGHQDPFCNLIVTTGGTGFAAKDVTPEAVEPLVDKKAAGLVHAMLASSLQITPFAAMARPVAGLRKKTLIVTLPGSPKGAKENLQAILKLLPHACIQAAGGDSRSLHVGGVEKLEHEAGIGHASGDQSRLQHTHGHERGHDHSHGPGGHAVPQPHTKPSDIPISNDPQAGPTARHRESPYPLLSVDAALKLILEHTPAPTEATALVSPSLVGSILAENVTSPSPVPAFRASIVDGYAVITADGTSTKGVFPVASVSHAAPGTVPSLQPGTIARITTGAPLPLNATAVVMVEDTMLRSTTSSGREEAEVEILAGDIRSGENVREVGSDIQMGETILRSCEKITAVGGELGLLASVGRAAVKIYKKPVVGILSTGDEIVPHDQETELRLGAVRDCNRPTLMAVVRGWGYDVVDLGIARDAPGDLESTLRASLHRADVIITSGGVSMGELDLLKPTIERSLGGTIHFGRVAMKPGKPTTFATIPFKNPHGDPARALIFSLPGNPASAVVTAGLFVRPCLDKYSGISDGLGMPRVSVVLDEDVRRDPKREEYQRASVWQGDDQRLYAAITGGQRSSRIGSFRAANALLVVSAGEGVSRKGDVVKALMMGPLGGA